MWDWVKDSDLSSKFNSFSRFEKFALFWWAFLPFMWSKIGNDKLSDTYIIFSKIFEVVGINFDAVYRVLFILVMILFISRSDVVWSALKPPNCEFNIFFKFWGKIFIGALILAGLAALYLFYSRPEILLEMKNMSQGARVPDWVVKVFKEEFIDRLIFYYIMLSFAGRNGAFLLSMLFFAFSHNYSNAYILSMMFSGSFFLFLMLWSGSLSLPIVVHLLANGAIFFWFVLMS